MRPRAGSGQGRREKGCKEQQKWQQMAHGALQKRKGDHCQVQMCMCRIQEGKYNIKGPGIHCNSGGGGGSKSVSQTPPLLGSRGWAHQGDPTRTFQAS